MRRSLSLLLAWGLTGVAAAICVGDEPVPALVPSEAGENVPPGAAPPAEWLPLDSEPASHGPSAEPPVPCGCPQCQAKTESPPKKPASPPQPWKPLFFENDFSYLADPCHDPLLGECLKNMPCDGCGFFDGTLSVGGELRHRFMDEENRLRPAGPGESSYDLWRWRNYVDYRAGDAFRVYVESIDAAIFNEDLPPTPIDLNRWDILNAFVDVKVAERDERPVYFRAGRQELLYGAQRLVSPLDWSNTRRNFEGVKLTSKGEVWDVDAFAVRPVNTATGSVPLSRYDHERDRADESRTFNGVYSVYRGLEKQTFDFYWLWLREQEPIPAFADGSRHTTGMRWNSIYEVAECDVVRRVWVLDVEGAYQFGHDNNRTVSAGFFTSTLTHTWKQMTWQPALTGLYYWGSGDRDPNDDEDNTFSVLFPLGHAYWGIIDNLSGQNLINYSVQASVKPTQKLTLLAAMHWFDLASADDTVYNVAGARVGVPGTGGNIGEELDLIGTYVLNPNLSVQAGYSWFWYGTYIDRATPRDDARQFYVQTTLAY